MSQNFKPGELVDLTIRGARVKSTNGGGSGESLILAYAEVERGVFATVELRHPDADSVTIERVAPAEWPPRPGDLWRDCHDVLWFTTTESDVANPFMRTTDYSGNHARNLLEHVGPLTLVHREN